MLIVGVRSGIHGAAVVIPGGVAVVVGLAVVVGFAVVAGLAVVEADVCACAGSITELTTGLTHLSSSMLYVLPAIKVVFNKRRRALCVTVLRSLFIISLPETPIVT